MKVKKLVYGVLAILLAVYLIVSRLGIIPAIPVFKIMITAVLAYVAVCSILKLEFGAFFISLACIAWQYDYYLGIEAITPWIVLLAAVLLTIGCECLFQNQKKKARRWVFNHDGMHFEFGNHFGKKREEGITCSYNKETRADGEYAFVENSLGETTRYIDSYALKYAQIDNGVGQCTVYFNKCTLVEDAMIKVDNGLGRTEIYIPSNWRIDLKVDNALGSVNTIGTPSNNPSDPSVVVEVDNGLGSVDIKII